MRDLGKALEAFNSASYVNKSLLAIEVYKNKTISPKDIDTIIPDNIFSDKLKLFLADVAQDIVNTL
jgi:hypothetical protein